jgi:hypothetical protein
MLIVADAADKWRHAGDADDGAHRSMGMLDR